MKFGADSVRRRPCASLSASCSVHGCHKRDGHLFANLATVELITDNLCAHRLCRRRKTASLALRPTELLIFVNAKAGTPLMQSHQTLGIDLSLKVRRYRQSVAIVQ